MTMDLLHACCNSQELYDTALSYVQNVIIVTDDKGHILFASPVVKKILGYLPDELKGKDLSILFAPEDLTYLYPNLLYMARKNKPFEGELMLIRKDGTRFFAFMIFGPGFDPGQRKSIIVICIQDIDRQKQLEKTIRKLRLNDLVNIANGIAHELRNPLVGIGGCVNRIHKLCKHIPDQDRYYDNIMFNLGKIERLVKKIEFFALLPEPFFTKVSMKKVVEEALRPYLQQIEMRKIDVAISMGQEILLVDRAFVLKAFLILVENALEALSDEGTITINGKTENTQYKVCVTDTGSGISPEDLPFIFNPFFSTKASGTGMDLAVVKRIMDSHGGHVEARSKQDKGTTFLLSFPLERRRPIRISLLENHEQDKK